MSTGSRGRHRRIRVGRVPVDVLSFEEALAAVLDLSDAGKGGFVVTPNIDHVVLAEHNPTFLAAYGAASLSLADGFPVVVTSRLMPTRLPAKVSGSDLVPPLVALCAKRKKRLYLLGAGPGVADLAAKKLVEMHPDLVIAGIDAPMVDLSKPKESRSPIVERVVAAKPDIVLVAFGAPKQELFCHEIAEAVSPAVLLGIGATLDFIAGTVKRAPSWMSRFGLEWAYRFGQEPRRLFHRYFVQDPQYLGIVFRQYLDDRRAGRPFGAP
jgi:N-acetylglucosaminyldiphosphoundecaprenol N-acetyl-beta-D-mannosaminyltransferase